MFKMPCAVAAPIAARNGLPNTQGRPSILEHMRKIRLSKTKKPGSGEVISILRKYKRRKLKVVYVDHHKRETLMVSPNRNRPVIIANECHSCPRLIKYK